MNATNVIALVALIIALGPPVYKLVAFFRADKIKVTRKDNGKSVVINRHMKSSDIRKVAHLAK